MRSIVLLLSIVLPTITFANNERNMACLAYCCSTDMVFLHDTGHSWIIEQVEAGGYELNPEYGDFLLDAGLMTRNDRVDYARMEIDKKYCIEQHGLFGDLQCSGLLTEGTMTIRKNVKYLGMEGEDYKRDVAKSPQSAPWQLDLRTLPITNPGIPYTWVISLKSGDFQKTFDEIPLAECQTDF